MNKYERFLHAINGVRDRAEEMSDELDSLRSEIEAAYQQGRDLGINVDEVRSLLPKVRGAVIPPDDGGDEDAGEASATQAVTRAPITEADQSPREKAFKTMEAEINGATATTDADHAQAIAEEVIGAEPERAGPPAPRGDAA